MYYRCQMMWPALALVLVFQTATGQTMLDQYKWNSRMLLVFAPSDQDPRYAATRLEAQAAACQIQDRDLVIAWLPLSGPSHLGKRPLAADAQQRLRERYRIGTDDFVVVLIGKDGGEKDRSEDIPDLKGLFSLIDSMPMRQSEMAARPADCGSD